MHLVSVCRQPPAGVLQRGVCVRCVPLPSSPWSLAVAPSLPPPLARVSPAHPGAFAHLEAPKRDCRLSHPRPYRYPTPPPVPQRSTEGPVLIPNLDPRAASATVPRPQLRSVDAYTPNISDASSVGEVMPCCTPCPKSLQSNLCCFA